MGLQPMRIFPSAACLGPNPDTLEKRNKGSWQRRERRDRERLIMNLAICKQSITITCAYPVWQGPFLNQALICLHIFKQSHVLLLCFKINILCSKMFICSKINYRLILWVFICKKQLKELCISLNIYLLYKKKAISERIKHDCKVHFKVD